MFNIATSIIQSKKLIAAGLNPETADMIYVSISDITNLPQYILEVRNIIKNFNKDEIPAWSLSSLIEISNDCGWYGDDFNVGDCNSESVIESFVEFIYEMLTDDGEDDNTGSILKWQEKYKINNNE